MSRQVNVIICGGAKDPYTDGIKRIIGKNTEKYFIGVDAGSLALLNAGYPLDAAIGDFDSVSKEELHLIEEESKQVIKYPSDKDDTDMELALDYAISSFPDAVYNIFGAVGEQKGRLDHMLANIWLGYQPRFKSYADQIHFIEKNHYFQYLLPGRHELQPREKTDYFSIISLTPIENISIENAVYNLKRQDIGYPRAMISNEFISDEDPIHLAFTEGLMLVMWVNEEKD